MQIFFPSKLKFSFFYAGDEAEAGARALKVWESFIGTMNRIRALTHIRTQSLIRTIPVSLIRTLSLIRALNHVWTLRLTRTIRCIRYLRVKVI